MLSSALGRNICDSALKYLEKCLLYAFAAYVACNGYVLGLLCDLIDFIDIDDTDLRALDVVISSNDQLEKDILNVFTDVTRLSKACSVSNGKRNI